MKRFLTLSLLVTFITSCISYDKRYFEFNNDELSYFNSYSIGDTIYFSNGQKDFDTIVILKIDSERVESHGGFMNQKPNNSKWVVIKHLPIDHWTGTMQEEGKPIQIVYQSLLLLSKDPIEKRIDYIVGYRNFYSYSENSIGEFHKDTLVLNGQKIIDYFVVKNAYPERITSPREIVQVYWTRKDGLTAYKSGNGEIWTLFRK